MLAVLLVTLAALHRLARFYQPMVAAPVPAALVKGDRAERAAVPEPATVAPVGTEVMAAVAAAATAQTAVTLPEWAAAVDIWAAVAAAAAAVPSHRAPVARAALEWALVVQTQTAGLVLTLQGCLSTFPVLELAG